MAHHARPSRLVKKEELGKRKTNQSKKKSSQVRKKTTKTSTKAVSSGKSKKPAQEKDGKKKQQEKKTIMSSTSRFLRSSVTRTLSGASWVTLEKADNILFHNQDSFNVNGFTMSLRNRSFSHRLSQAPTVAKSKKACEQAPSDLNTGSSVEAVVEDAALMLLSFPSDSIINSESNLKGCVETPFNTVPNGKEPDSSAVDTSDLSSAILLVESVPLAKSHVEAESDLVLPSEEQDSNSEPIVTSEFNSQEHLLADANSFSESCLKAGWTLESVSRDISSDSSSVAATESNSLLHFKGESSLAASHMKLVVDFVPIYTELDSSLDLSCTRLNSESDSKNILAVCEPVPNISLNSFDVEAIEQLAKCIDAETFILNSGYVPTLSPDLEKSTVEKISGESSGQFSEGFVSELPAGMEISDLASEKAINADLPADSRLQHNDYSSQLGSVGVSLNLVQHKRRNEGVVESASPVCGKQIVKNAAVAGNAKPATGYVKKGNVKN